MTLSIYFLFGILIALSLASPVGLIWGWTRWIGGPKLKTLPAILSLAGFIFATASATLAVLLLAYALVHRFPYYNPRLISPFALGTMLSLAGLLFGLGGASRESSLRWHAPICALGTLAFWILATGGE